MQIPRFAALRSEWHVILSAELMSLRRATLHENARSALECGSEAAALKSQQKAVADATTLQGAFGTAIFMAAKDLHYFARREETQE